MLKHVSYVGREEFGAMCSSLNENKLHLYWMAVSCCQISGSIFLVCLHFCKMVGDDLNWEAIESQVLYAFWPHILRKRKLFTEEFHLKPGKLLAKTQVGRKKRNKHFILQSLGSIAFSFL